MKKNESINVTSETVETARACSGSSYFLGGRLRAQHLTSFLDADGCIGLEGDPLPKPDDVLAGMILV